MWILEKGNREETFRIFYYHLWFIFMFCFYTSSCLCNTVLLKFIVSFMSIYFRVWMDFSVIRHLLRLNPMTIPAHVICVDIYSHVYARFMFVSDCIFGNYQKDMCVSVLHCIGNYICACMGDQC